MALLSLNKQENKRLCAHCNKFKVRLIYFKIELSHQEHIIADNVEFAY